MVRRGELVRLRYGTYATASVVAAAKNDRVLRHALDLQAVLVSASAPDVVASHESAALIHHLPLLNEPEGIVSLTRPPGRYQGRSAAGVRYFAAALPAEHVTVKHDVPVTTVSRTVTDIARTLPFLDAIVVADAAIHALKTSKPKMTEVIATCKGWPDTGKARRVLDFSNGLAESPLESCARVAFDALGLPRPDLQAKIFVHVGGEYHEFTVDFLWRDHMTIAETDGLTKYDSGADAIRELKRDRLLRERGYKVVHITWAEMLGDPERVIKRILRAFEATSAY